MVISTISTPKADENYLTPDEAAAYIGVSGPEFANLCKQYGIGRYHLNRDHDQIVYSKRDLAQVKLAAPATKAPPTATAA